jgi:cytochrome c556
MHLMMKTIIKAALVGAGLVLTTGSIAQPQQSPEQQAQAAVNTRKSVVRLFNFNMAPINAMARGGEFDAALVERNAKRIATLAPMLPEAFAAMDTRAFTNLETGALPVIWEDPAAFQQKANDLVEAMNSLAAAAATGNRDETIRLAGTIGRTYCGGCHQQFRRMN